MNNGDESHRIESVNNHQIIKYTHTRNRRKWMTKFWMSQTSFGLIFLQAKPCPLSILNNTRFVCLFYWPVFQGKRAGQQKNVDFLKWVKDDLPNSSATGFWTAFNSSWVYPMQSLMSRRIWGQMEWGRWLMIMCFSAGFSFLDGCVWSVATTCWC